MKREKNWSGTFTVYVTQLHANTTAPEILHSLQRLFQLEHRTFREYSGLLISSKRKENHKQ